MSLDAGIPSSTYRLQISGEFTLFDAALLVDYLEALGVGAVYVSPLLQSTRGSAHGYDVVDHDHIDEARGGSEGLDALAKACQGAGMGLVVDIVPNHMGVTDARENARWWRLLEAGSGADEARWFDVDWAFGRGRVLLPILPDGADLAQDLVLEETMLGYGSLRFPLAPGSAPPTATPLEVHARQHYELISSRRADVDQNYRRFFAVSSLAAIRVEDTLVFDSTHREILRWVDEGLVSGLRVDHPDGLADPAAYLERVAAAAPDTWLVVEKILEPDEMLAAQWPVGGTTGYDALGEVNALLVDPGAEAELDACYRDLTGDQRNWSAHFVSGKAHTASTVLSAEVLRVARLVPELPDAPAALRALAAAFPVYRSYLPLGEEHLVTALRQVGAQLPELTATLSVLGPRLADPSDELAVRFQQLTGAVMAKGIEDTAFYRYSRFIAFNEVGASPGCFGAQVEQFHAAATRRHERSPRGMTALSTHDTKRGEDVRAHLAVIAELPGEWRALAARLLELEPIPNRSFAYLLWQTVVATGLIERERLHAYAEKAMREADDETGWRDPDPAFEQSVHRAVDHAYDRVETRALISAFAARLAPFGQSNSLSQKLIQLTMPGVPDVYQGSEYGEHSLVDPDNRRAVDFDALAATLRRLDTAGCSEVANELGAGEAKLALTAAALRARRHRPELFSAYRPLAAEGRVARHLVAFDRGGALAFATRLPVGLEAAGGFADASVRLPAGRYRDVLSGEVHAGVVRIAAVLASRPATLLLAEDTP